LEIQYKHKTFCIGILSFLQIKSTDIIKQNSLGSGLTICSAGKPKLSLDLQNPNLPASTLSHYQFSAAMKHFMQTMAHLALFLSVDRAHVACSCWQFGQVCLTSLKHSMKYGMQHAAQQLQPTAERCVQLPVTYSVFVAPLW